MLNSHCRNILGTVASRLDPAILSIAGLCLLAVIPSGAVVAADTADPLTFRLEAEEYCANEDQPLEIMEGASGGNVVVMKKNYPKTPQIVTEHTTGKHFTVTKPGPYRLWVRYFKRSLNFGGVGVLIRDESGEGIAFHKCHFEPNYKMKTARPYQDFSAPYLKRQGWVWESFPVIFERPMLASIEISKYLLGGVWDRPVVDCFVLSGQKGFDPSVMTPEALSQIRKLEPATLAPQALSPPKGYQSASPIRHHSQFFSGVHQYKDMFDLDLINCKSLYFDYSRHTALGFNQDHTGYWNKPDYPLSYGIHYNARLMYFPSPMSWKERQSTEGKMVFMVKKTPENKGGKEGGWEPVVGKGFSLSYPIYQEKWERTIEKYANIYKDDSGADSWVVCPEVGGWLDYSPYAKEDFIKWLSKHYKNIKSLNAIWDTTYADFKEIQISTGKEDNLAGYVDFRAFSNEMFCGRIRKRIEIIRKVDQHNKPILFANTMQDFLSPYFKNLRPLDMDYYLNVTLNDVDTFSWDTYSVDGYFCSQIDFIRGITDNRKELFIQEWNVHTPSTRIAARSFWAAVGKGVKGMSLYQSQSSDFQANHPKWSLTHEDFTPKKKLGAFSDAAHEIHRLEPLLMAAKVTYPVKPVAIYYSNLDLALAKPRASHWGGGHDSMRRVYDVLRGAGYTVTWITPRQIIKGGLQKVGAVVMINAQYVDAKAAVRLEKWVRDGGVIMGDRFPGAWDRHGKPQHTLSPVFGIKKALVKAKNANSTAMQESRQGYGSETGLAFEAKKLQETITEIYQQWDSTHEVAMKLGDFMLSGYGFEKVECLAGEVIGMSYVNSPGIVLNEYGKGKALYFSAFMGTLYDSSATRYEWTGVHSGTSYEKLLRTFLEYAGVHPASEVHIRHDRQRIGVIVEKPMLTPEKNVLIGLVNMNTMPLSDFELSVELPEDARSFGAVYAVSGGNRRLHPLKFKVNGSRLRVDMVGFDSHAMIVALNQSRPLIGLSLSGIERGDAGLGHVTPAKEFKVTAEVWNPSNVRLQKGDVRLFLPKGWFQDVSNIGLEGIEPWQSKTVSFSIRAPAICGNKRLRPLVVKYEAGDVRSTPATEIVWWE